MRGELQVEFANAIIRQSLIVSLKWWEATRQLEGQDAEAPDVDCAIVCLVCPCHHFRRQIVESAAHRLAAVRRGVN